MFNHSSQFDRLALVSVAALLLGTMLVPDASGWQQPATPCPCAVDGVCQPNGPWGHTPTKWRPWPGDVVGPASTPADEAETRERLQLDPFELPPIVKEGQELRFRIVTRQLLNGRRPSLHFPLITLPDGGHQQVVFALEVLVERRLRHAGRSEDLINAHRLKAVAVKQLDRYMDQAGTSRLGRFGKPEQFNDRLVLAAIDHAAIISDNSLGCTSSAPGGYSESTVRIRN